MVLEEISELQEDILEIYDREEKILQIVDFLIDSLMKPFKGEKVPNLKEVIGCRLNIPNPL